MEGRVPPHHVAPRWWRSTSPSPVLAVRRVYSHTPKSHHQYFGIDNARLHPSSLESGGASANGERDDLRDGSEGDRGRETRSAVPSALASEQASSSRSTRRGEKEDGEAKGIFGLRSPDQERGCRRKTRGEGCRELQASGQAPAGGVGEDIRYTRRGQPLPPGSELQVLSSEAEGAGGADEAEGAWKGESFEDESPPKA